MIGFSLILIAICLLASLFAGVMAIRSSQRSHRVGWTAAAFALFGGAAAILLQPVETHAVKIDLPVN